MRARAVGLGGVALSSAACVAAAWAPVTATWAAVVVCGLVVRVGLVAYGLWLADRGQGR